MSIWDPRTNPGDTYIEYASPVHWVVPSSSYTDLEDIPIYYYVEAVAAHIAAAGLTDEQAAAQNRDCYPSVVTLPDGGQFLTEIMLTDEGLRWATLMAAGLVEFNPAPSECVF
jgi:hypothetical protein